MWTNVAKPSNHGVTTNMPPLTEDLVDGISYISVLECVRTFQASQRLDCYSNRYPRYIKFFTKQGHIEYLV
jgi:hypothetical protein